MVKKIPQKLRPKQGFAHFFHLGFTAFLPLLVFIFIRVDLVGVALAVILLSKWRIFAVRPRHWFAHIRTNAVDLIFSLSILAFMTHTSAMSIQLLWVIAYELWILYIKPGTSPLLVSLQALLAQSAGLIALFVAFENSKLGVYIVGVTAILYFCARHYFGSFEEKNLHAYSWTWALFGACLIWILGHWLLFFGPIAQPALILAVTGYGLSAMYYLAETDKLSKVVQRQVVFVTIALITVILVFSDWGNRTL
jgi:hypothetical protein